MESKRVMMCVTVMIVIAMGNLLVQTEAQASIITCLPGCLFDCATKQGFPALLMCPVTCFTKCLAPHGVMSLTDADNHSDYYCKLGCSTHHCSPLYSPQNLNVNKVVECVGSCSDKCSTKN